MRQQGKQPDAERLYVVVQHLSRRLRDIELNLGLTPARFAVLVDLAFHGATNVGDLARQERVSRPAMTRLIHDMASAGFVVTRPDAKDRRGVVVTLSSRGRVAMTRVRRRKVALIAEALTALKGPARRALPQVINALEKIRRPA